MPKTSMYVLTWLPDEKCYALRVNGQVQMLPIEDEQWRSWLNERASFAFRGRRGQLTLLKEERARGTEGYWYAYRSRGKRTLKKYVGRGSDLTPARLEEVAGNLSNRTGESARSAHTSQPMSPHQAPLLIPKLRTPQARGALVARPRLLERLDAGLEGKLTLISAPAGFGKTTLVSQWIAAHSQNEPRLPLAWVELDAGDNDPVRFWRYVITACQPLLLYAGQAALAHLQAPPSTLEPATLEMTLTIFLNELAQSTRRGVLVLEDYHLITAPRITETLTFLLEHLPATLHLVLITRSDPTLPLAKLRARGTLHELRAHDLRFSRAESHAFFQQTLPVPLTQRMLAHLETRLEGWVAGLRLVVLALQGDHAPTEIERFLMNLAGSQRSILSYFVAEVLEAQPEAVQQFLLATSILNRLTGSLCDAIRMCSGSATILDQLEQANLFLEPLDSAGEWYRYHALFAEAMQHEARRRLGENILRELAGRASLWYERQEQFAEAIEMAFQAGQLERSAMLMEQVSAGMNLQYTNEFYTFYNWFERLPEAAFRERPVLCLEYVMILIFAASARPLAPVTQARAEAFLRMAEEHARVHDDQPTLGHVATLRSLHAWYMGQMEQALTYARQALAWLPPDNLRERSASLSVIGRGEVLAGRFEEATRILQEARTMCEAFGNTLYARAMINILSGVSIEQAELHKAAITFQATLAEAREQGDLDDIAHTQMALAQLAYEWNDLDAAQTRAREALEIGAQLLQPAHQANATLLLARIAHARGAHAHALQLLSDIQAHAQPHHIAQFEREARVQQARFQLVAGNFTAVQYWLDTRPPRSEMLSVMQYTREELLVARFWLAQHEAERALTLLQALLPNIQASRHIQNALETCVLMALAYHAQQRLPEALQALQSALTTARPAGYLRLFLDEGLRLLDILRLLLTHTREKALLAYIQRILRAFATEPGILLSLNTEPSDALLLREPLSPRERRVLHLLVSGLSNPQIAHELVVSVNTVRTQVQSIYRKLDVNNRVAASERARELKLM